MAVPQDRLHTLNVNKQFRGDAALEPTIVETYKFGNSTVHIASDYFVKTREEIEKVVDTMHAIGWLIIKEASARGEKI
jgi:hypothetical protein